MDDKQLIKQLNIEQLKTLILLGIIEGHRVSEQYFPSFIYYISSLNDINLNTQELDNVLHIELSSLKVKFDINNYSMIIIDSGGRCKKDISYVLRLYLTNIFKEKYTDYLYEKRINDAINERKALLEDAENVLSNYGPPPAFFKNNDAKVKEKKLN